MRLQDFVSAQCSDPRRPPYTLLRSLFAPPSNPRQGHTLHFLERPLKMKLVVERAECPVVFLPLLKIFIAVSPKLGMIMRLFVLRNNSGISGKL